MKPSAAVKEFHEKFNIRKAHPHDMDSIGFRMCLIAEEFKEVLEAGGLRAEVQVQRTMEPIETAHLLKELADLAYVIYGTAEALGWDLDEAIKRVHESNLSKLDENGCPIYREDGKVLKSNLYKEPYLGDLV